ncbi:transcription termination factor MTERF8, chloroplastic-like [Carex rostrata]
MILSRLHHIRQFTTPYASSIHRLLSTTTTPAPLLNPHFSIEYLIQSCGLPSDEAIRVSKEIQHLKSPDKPDSVLQFLRQTGISESDIRTSVSRRPRILCSSVEKIWRPNVAKLQEVGISIEVISFIVSRSPGVFQSNFAPKVDFWIRVLSSVENLSLVLKRFPQLLMSSLEKVIVPNLSFLEEQCGLSLCQIAQLIKNQPRLMSSRAETLKMYAKRADELGIARSSQMFVYALVVVSSVNQSIIDARLHNLKSLGFSQDEVTSLVCSNPSILQKTEENIGSKVQFLIKEAGCDKLHVIRNTALLTLSLEKRLIPRSLVRKLLEKKGLPEGKRGLYSFAQPNEKQFLEKIVLPYEQTIPGLHRAYIDSVSGKTSAKEWFASISN